MNLHGSVVLVTGATGGLGQQFVATALERGAAKVYAGARRDHDWNDPRIVPLRLDVADAGAIEHAASTARDVTVLISNAGQNRAPSLLTSPEEEIRATYETHVFGPLRLVRAFAPVLAQSGGGAVVDVHSVLSDPKVIVGRIVDALEDGQDEAIADDVSAQVKSILPGVTADVIPQ